jgi:N-acetylneuraminic acid mutarotase
MNKEHIAHSAFFKARILVTLPLCAVAACFLVSRPLLAFLRPEAPTNDSQRTLTFAQRVAYQRAIEEVYWRHRIWPKENLNPKPSLDAVMSQAQLETKVANYLHNSQCLEDYWQRPFTSEQLQAEMDRMASDTRQPEVLRELFGALGNDPLVIAECLARPILLERLVGKLKNEDRLLLTTVARLRHPLPSDVTTVEMELPKKVAAIDSIAKAVQVNRPYQLPAISSASGGCTDDTWTPTSVTDVPAGRTFHTAVWTGSEMIVWGGVDLSGYLNTGGRYNPSTDSWTATSTASAPDARELHTAVWTGTEMIVWGGYGGTDLNSGGRYNPSADSWTPTSVTNAPDARDSHAAVWTGSEMIVWGGFSSGSYFNTGARYDPSTDNWVATSAANAPDARALPTAVWTGSEMITWGGFDSSSDFNTGGKYNPGADSWTATSTTNAPDARDSHTAVWTGSEMIVWGGETFNFSVLNTGGRYNPGTDSWIATSTSSAPAARDAHTAVWTSSQMIVWGGFGASFLNTGGRYNPSTDSWTATSTDGAPAARDFHTAVWTGSQMIIWGGAGPGPTYFNSGGRYCVSAASPTPTPTATPTITPTATPTPTATLTPSPAPRVTPTPRPRPTPAPRP